MARRCFPARWDMAKIASSNLVGIVTNHLFLVASVVDIFGGVAI